MFTTLIVILAIVLLFVLVEILRRFTIKAIVTGVRAQVAQDYAELKADVQRLHKGEGASGNPTGPPPPRSQG